MIWKIAWKNTVHKPLSSILCISLVLFGVGIISLLTMIQQRFENKFSNDLKDIDIVVGAKGSPLQLVLSAVYHIDSPTGNINMSEAEKIMQRPMVKEAIPLAYGDTYEGYRILGTTLNYPKKYDAELQSGRFIGKAMEVTIGFNVADKTGLKVGDVFTGTHGKVKGDMDHYDHPYTVVGVLKKSGTVLDHLILTELESVWKVHDEESENESHDSVSESVSNEREEEEHHHAESEDKEITAILIQCKTKFGVMQMPRMINLQTNMQAVLPGLELNRLFYMLGTGVTTLSIVGGGIMMMAGFSVFLVLLGRLRERKHELALMRSVGYSPFKLFSLLLIEGVFLSTIGYIFGALVSRVGLYIINQQAASEFHLKLSMEYTSAELMLFLITVGIGIIAALIPAISAMRMNVSSALSEK